MRKKRTKKQNRQLRQISLIKSYAKQGLSANKALAKLKLKGLGMRKQFFLNNYRAAKHISKKVNVSKYIPKKYAISAKEYKPGVILTPGKKYRYFLDVQVYNTTLKKVIEKKAIINSSKKLSKKKLQDNINILFDPVDGQSGEEDEIQPTIIAIEPIKKANQKEADAIHKATREKNKKKKDAWINATTQKEFDAQMAHTDRLIKKKQKEIADMIAEQQRTLRLRKKR